MRSTSIIAALLIGCAEPEPEPVDLTCDGEGDRMVLLARSMRFARETTPGQSEGFNLDNRVSDASDTQACGIEDMVDSEGTPGIDNAMSGLMPLLEQTEAAVLEALIQDSIGNGALLMMAELSDLDDELNDPCVDVSVFKGLGEPMLGADGWVLPYQTLRVDPTSLGNDAAANPLVDGRIDAGPIDRIALPIQVLDLDTTLELFNARIRAERGEDGVWRGLMGGGLEINALIDTAALQNVDPVVSELIGPVLALMADLEPDENGTCTQLSVTIELELVPAFVYEGE